MSDVQDQLDGCHAALSTLTSHQKMILFSSSLLKEILSEADESSFSKSVVVTRDCLVRLWLEMSWVRHWCSCVLGYSDVTEVSDW